MTTPSGISTLVAIAASLLTGVAASGATINTSVTDDKPTENVLIDTGAFSGNFAWNGLGTSSANSHRDVGQVFKATASAPMEAIVFQLHAVFNNPPLNAPISFSIFEVSGPKAFPASAPLYTATGNLPGSMANNQWLTFELDVPLQLTASKYYAVQLGFAELGPDVRLSLYSGGITAYADGDGFFFANAAADVPQTYVAAKGDFGMLVIIPEGHTFALLLVGCAALLLPLRQRLSRRTALSS